MKELTTPSLKIIMKFRCPYNGGLKCLQNHLEKSSQLATFSLGRIRVKCEQMWVVSQVGPMQEDVGPTWYIWGVFLDIYTYIREMGRRSGLRETCKNSLTGVEILVILYCTNKRAFQVQIANRAWCNGGCCCFVRR